MSYRITQSRPAGIPGKPNICMRGIELQLGEKILKQIVYHEQGEDEQAREKLLEWAEKQELNDDLISESLSNNQTND